MASPIAHSLAGAAIYFWSARKSRAADWREEVRQHWPTIALFALLANLPDSDFIIGWIAMGDLHAFHHGWTHSIVAALGAALLTALIVRIRPRFFTSFLWYLAAVGSHHVIDFFTGPELGLERTYGMPLWWPFDDRMIQAPASLVVGPKHQTGEQLISAHNWLWAAYESVVFGILLFLTIKVTTPRHP